MKKINTDLMKKIELYPATLIEDIEIFYSPYEGFIISKYLPECKSDPQKTITSSFETAIILFKAIKNLAERKNIGKKECHTCLITDDIDTYHYQVKLLDNEFELIYREKDEENSDFPEQSAIKLGSVEKTTRLVDSFFDIVKELMEEDNFENTEVKNENL